MRRGHFLVIGLLIGFITYGESVLLTTGLQIPATESEMFPELVTGQDIAKYKNQCRPLDLSMIQKDPYALNGQKVWIEGTVFKKELDECLVGMLLKRLRHVHGFHDPP
ncbi:MAG: hypothetical protein H5T40_08065 [Methanobacteriales archaeon]|nr:hypothetical protein [Methanobacteriales archaeon]